MEDRRIGAGLLAIRLCRGMTQEEVAIAAGVPRSVVQLVERGRLARVRIDDLRSIAIALDATLDVSIRWHGGDLGRLVNARHAALHEALALRFVALPQWRFEPEVSFSVYGERGVVDGLAWHPGTRSLLVIELKTEFVDINELMGGVDRKRRLAPVIASERGWRPATVSSWVAVADGRTNRRALARHETTLRAKFRSDGHGIAAWLREPSGSLDALGFLTVAPLASTGVAVGGTRRVHRARPVAPGRDVRAS